MSSGSVLTASAAATRISQTWVDIDRLAYQDANIYPTFAVKDALHGTLHIPLVDTYTASTLASTSDLGEPAFSVATEAEKTFTPSWCDLNVSLTDMLLVRAAYDSKEEDKRSIAKALGVKVDTDAAALFAALTTNVVGAYGTDIDLAQFLQAKSLVRQGAGEYSGDQTMFAYGNLQEDAVLAINNFISAQIRGIKNSAADNGMLVDAYGVRFIASGNLSTSGGGYNNALYISRAFAIAWNQKIKTEVQRHGKAWWLLGGGDYGLGTVRDRYAALVKSRAA